jgi:hypothetical protein
MTHAIRIKIKWRGKALCNKCIKQMGGAGVGPDCSHGQWGVGAGGQSQRRETIMKQSSCTLGGHQGFTAQVVDQGQSEQ